MDAADKKPDHTTNHLANERTFLAWLRTCIVLFGLGFIMAKYDILLEQLALLAGNTKMHDISVSSSALFILGTGIIAFAVALIIYALKNYLDTFKAIEKDVYVSKHPIIYFASIGMVILGLIVITYLIVVFG